MTGRRSAVSLPENIEIAGEFEKLARQLRGRRSRARQRGAKLRECVAHAGKRSMNDDERASKPRGRPPRDGRCGGKPQEHPGRVRQRMLRDVRRCAQPSGRSKPPCPAMASPWNPVSLSGLTIESCGHSAGGGGTNGCPTRKNIKNILERNPRLKSANHCREPDAPLSYAANERSG